MTENQPLRVLFLDMDGVMISDVGMKRLPANREDVRAHGYCATPDPSALFALEMLLERTGARICLATTWLWNDFKDGTPGLEMAIRKLGLPADRYFQDHAIWIEARDGRGDRREDMEYQSKAHLIPQALDRWHAEGLEIAGYAFLDDNPGRGLFRRGDLRGARDLNLVEVNAMHGLSPREVVAAADMLGEPYSRDDEEHLVAQHDRWLAIRTADRLLRGHHSMEQMREHFLSWLQNNLLWEPRP